MRTSIEMDKILEFERVDSMELHRVRTSVTTENWCWQMHGLIKNSRRAAGQAVHPAYSPFPNRPN